MNYTGCTTLLQARNLVEAGLREHTADMAYVPLLGATEYQLVHLQNVKYTDFIKMHHLSIEPAWSLGRLLDLLPKTIVETGDSHRYFKLEPYTETTGYFLMYRDVNTTVGRAAILQGCKTMIEAAYEQMLYVLKRYPDNIALDINFKTLV